jgi:ribosome-associated translation inhibitor RaiA
MQILVNSDHHITGDETVTERVEALVNGTLGRFAHRITRVEVHLSDVNGPKSGDRDKRCMMEARLGGLKPLAASHQAPTLLEAMDGAVKKLERSIEHVLGRLEDSAGPTPPAEQIATVEELQELEASDAVSKGSHR